MLAEKAIDKAGYQSRARGARRDLHIPLYHCGDGQQSSAA